MMSVNVLDATIHYLNSHEIEIVASLVGESKTAVKKAMWGFYPIVLSGFISKSNDNDENAADVFDIVKSEFTNSENKDFNLCEKGIVIMEKGDGLMKALFGDKLNSLVSVISSFVSIRTTSSRLLFGLSGMIVARLVGKSVIENELQQEKFTDFLDSQKIFVLDMLPPGLLHVTSLLNLTDTRSNIHTTPAEEDNRASHQKAKKYFFAFLLFIICLLAMLMIWW